jgi:hypothetical protein
LHPESRIAFSPSLALAWVISKENFMTDVSAVDYLKLKLSGGIMATDDGVGSYYVYDDSYALSGGFYWYEGSRSRNGTIPSFGPNKTLGFEKRKDINVSLEGLLFNKRLSFEAGWFNNIRDRIVTRVQTLYPSWFTNYAPYDNYNSVAYRGVEIGLSWRQKWNDWSLTAGGNMLWNTSERLKVSEVYANDYQYRKGSPVDARFGLKAEGFFTDQQDIDNHAYQMFGEVQPGDIKYTDLNNDGYVDANDETEIGRWQAPFYFSFQLKLSYKCLTLFAMASAQTGATGYLGDSNYNNYYWQQGDVKYSEYMLNHWTEATKNTATYPRLSTRADDNNFRSSTFWLFNSDYFNLDRVQITYDVPVKPNNLLTVKTLSVFATASGLLTVGPNAGIRILNIGSAPQYRGFSIGLKTLF